MEKLEFNFFIFIELLQLKEKKMYVRLNYKLSNPPFLVVANIVTEAKHTLAKFINFSH